MGFFSHSLFLVGPHITSLYSNITGDFLHMITVLSCVNESLIASPCPWPLGEVTTTPVSAHLPSFHSSLKVSSELPLPKLGWIAEMSDTVLQSFSSSAFPVVLDRHWRLVKALQMVYSTSFELHEKTIILDLSQLHAA